MREKVVSERRLQGVELVGQIVAHERFLRCEFVGCVADGCSFGGCTFEECSFVGCRIADPRSQNSFLRACTFEDCELSGVDWSLWWPEDRNGSALAGVRSCRLERNAFDGLCLRGSSFAGSAVRQSRFDACDLRGCDLAGTGFADCRMQRADLTGARGYRLSLLRNRVQGARFTYPDCLALLEGTGAVVVPGEGDAAPADDALAGEKDGRPGTPASA
ncbi:MAG: pentapeptide repeat-containing protein [Olsenella sp.]|jgi:uncharacterized protein YjbI with pentapeptide repeats|nr:pentapeptide repeat-containing protein [Olsenella sp.]MCI1288681.1 pentapeptide repeat-containing protein [Olsenella sp.]